MKIWPVSGTNSGSSAGSPLEAKNGLDFFFANCFFVESFLIPKTLEAELMLKPTSFFFNLVESQQVSFLFFKGSMVHPSDFCW